MWSVVKWVSASQLPDGSASSSRETCSCGRSSSGRKCSTAISSRATGSGQVECGVQAGRSRMFSGSAQVGVDVGGGAGRVAGQQRPGVDQHDRVVVDVDDPGVRARRPAPPRGCCRAVGMPVPTSRNCRMPASLGQEADGPAQERAVLPGDGADCSGRRRDRARRTPGRPRSCPCRRASSCSAGPGAPPWCRSGRRPDPRMIPTWTAPSRDLPRSPGCVAVWHDARSDHGRCWAWERGACPGLADPAATPQETAYQYAIDGQSRRRATPCTCASPALRRSGVRMAERGGISFDPEPFA